METLEQEKQKKNLFTYATKELSQDAFLRWLFENYDDKELSPLVYELLNEFCEFKEGEIIKELKTKAQWVHIDISVWIKTTYRNVALFIEDKTFSSERNQLSAYDKHVDDIGEHEVYKVFYKTLNIGQDEQNRIDKANLDNSIKWKVYDISKIYEIFKKYANTKNVILSQYIAHIDTLHYSSVNVVRPRHNETVIDLLQWRTFFEKYVVGKIGEIEGTIHFNGGTNYRYEYLCYKKICLEEKVPYFEVRSRDCVVGDKFKSGSFQARILCYGMKETDFYRNEKRIIENIKNSEFKCEHLVYNKRGKRTFPKQIGFTERVPVNNDEEFIDLFKHYLNIYLDIMKDWQD